MADPYRNFKFEVEISGFTRAGFAKVSGLTHKVEVIEYREGGDNETPRKLPGQSSFDNITLERGLSSDSDFVDWISEMFSIDGLNGAQPPAEGFRRDITLYLKDKAGVRVKKWRIVNAWPAQYTPGDLDASSNDVVMASLEIAHEGWTETTL